MSPAGSAILQLFPEVPHLEQVEIMHAITELVNRNLAIPAEARLTFEEKVKIKMRELNEKSKHYG